MDGSSATFSKRSRSLQAAAAEVAGLEWLRAAEAAGGARVVRVLRLEGEEIELEHLAGAPATGQAARRFGAALARTHDAGAAGFGAPPDGFDGPCFLGRQELPTSPGARAWGSFFARDRVLFYLDRAEQRGNVSADEARIVRRAGERIAAGQFDDDDAPARLHGDLWNGNVMWTPDGVVLIDPAAHGGHRETDLAMLDLFGCPALDEVLAGYEEEHPLRPGWKERVPVHQLHPLAVHAASHGRSYAAPLVRAAQAVLALP
ncbi:fructosamine kinase family protein [Naasia sp. SYSU D00057]|uniref:fructosamine kinase family protein n=1 Tax=Naasia sp. SYSU D00057 TaxID=2817380 RepID=UPI001B316245|nr:fructosamine kinase family protein [Naasia sp. SYSU D00057]